MTACSSWCVSCFFKSFQRHECASRNQKSEYYSNFIWEHRKRTGIWFGKVTERYTKHTKKNNSDVFEIFFRGIPHDIPWLRWRTGVKDNRRVFEKIILHHQNPILICCHPCLWFFRKVDIWFLSLPQYLLILDFHHYLASLQNCHCSGLLKKLLQSCRGCPVSCSLLRTPFFSLYTTE